MKRMTSISTLLIALTLPAAACDVEKDDGLDTGAMVDEGEGDEGKADDEGESGSTGGSEDEPGTSGGTGDDGESDETDDGATSGGDDSDSSGGNGEPAGIALLHGELPDIDVGGSGDSGGSGTDGDSLFPDDALLVIIDNDDSATCEDPWGASECGGNWSISFTLLPEQQVPGTYELFELNGSSSYLGEPYPEGDCPGGGGTLDGVLVIESIDDTEVVGHIEDAEAWDFDANVAFVAPRC